MKQRDILKAVKEQIGTTQKEFVKYFGISLRTVEGQFTEKRGGDYLLRLMLYWLEVEYKVSNLMRYIYHFWMRNRCPIGNQKFLGRERIGDHYEKKSSMVLTVASNCALYSAVCRCKNKMETIFYL